MRRVRLAAMDRQLWRALRRLALAAVAVGTILVALATAGVALELPAGGLAPTVSGAGGMVAAADQCKGEQGARGEHRDLLLHVDRAHRDLVTDRPRQPRACGDRP